MTVKAQVLDTDFNVVVGGEFYDTGREGLVIPGISEDDPRWNPALMGNRRSGVVQNYIVDGQVDVDSARLTRRTMNIALMNPNAEFTPQSDWGGLFYVNRLVRLWRGVIIDGYEEYVPIGTFMLDTVDVVAERNMSIVTMAGSDLWKKLSKAKFGSAHGYAAGTLVQDVIKDMVDRSGVTRMVIDPLSHRSSNTKTLQADLNYEYDQIIGDELAKLATAWGLDVYFDPMGRFVSQEMRLERATVWTYEPGDGSSLLTVKSTYKDELLYNHVVVIGTGHPSGNPRIRGVQDLDPSSPTSVDRIGRRTYTYESTLITDFDQALDTARKLLAQHTKVVEEAELQTICNPAFEASDVISIKEPSFTMLNAQMGIKSFSIPLSSSRQTIRLTRQVVI